MMNPDDPRIRKDPDGIPRRPQGLYRDYGVYIGVQGLGLGVILGLYGDYRVYIGVT